MSEAVSLSQIPTVANLHALLNAAGHSQQPCEQLRWLVVSGYAEIPFPGLGHTLKRWQTLSTVAQHDLALAKLFESHADAQAILAELGHEHEFVPMQVWAVWCADPPGKRVRVSSSTSDTGKARIHGTKPWCSGAAYVRHALVSAWDEADRPRLVAVDMAQSEARVTRDGWHAVGMAATASVDVIFDGAEGFLVGNPGTYVDRPGFHHGAAGIAACWYGAASAIAGHVLEAVRRRPDNPHALAHLGTLDIVLAQARGQLRAAAAEIDAQPGSACSHAVRRARLAVEAAAETILQQAPRAVGAGPMCKNAHLARLMADLPVFIRQSHAERDLAEHGRAVAEQDQAASWML
ncbi:acyl-CoA dehydrogenase family protein [Bordetella sp. BOR01]|uniref:acyl-CoA dehydrogenase family protein n=1 Tax=Bordetella sp. BOR01 TaxID=2854779 RepID=UPI001C47AB0B|nr:acyl-CoA dehydrogenase family protein [Bordetella sp. BOR01]MBV7481395.1 acyl-CoA/acyl-ACP dehydrogenase [Bordetella sp. BOR01]